MKVSGQKLDQKVKELMVEKKFFMKKISVKLALIPLGESLKFLALIISINLVLEANNNLYPQIYLNECFYEL